MLPTPRLRNLCTDLKNIPREKKRGCFFTKKVKINSNASLAGYGSSITKAPAPLVREIPIPTFCPDRFPLTTSTSAFIAWQKRSRKYSSFSSDLANFNFEAKKEGTHGRLLFWLITIILIPILYCIFSISAIYRIIFLLSPLSYSLTIYLIFKY